MLFGSYGKGSATEKSDVDLLVDSSLKGLRFIGLLGDVQQAVGKEVDLFDVTHIEAGSRIDKEIKETGVTVYENNIIAEKLIAYTDKIFAYCAGYDHESFCSDSGLVEACVFNLSQMGELANRVDYDFAEAHSDIPWRYIYGLRNRIVHDYEGVNLQ